MDTSEEYIHQCDCEEVQEHRRYDGGDWICDPNDGHSWAIWQRVRGATDEGMRKFMDGLLWLPRQDQIQDMMEWKNEYHFWEWEADTFDGDKAGSYHGQILDNEDLVYGVSMSSLEQLWLAFYMYEKYGKIWDGDKWVSNK